MQPSIPAIEEFSVYLLLLLHFIIVIIIVITWHSEDDAFSHMKSLAQTHFHTTNTLIPCLHVAGFESRFFGVRTIIICCFCCCCSEM